MLTYPAATKEDFHRAVDDAIQQIGHNKAFQRVEKGNVTLGHYHSTLQMIFHQTFQGPATFAQAAATCDIRHFSIRDYFIHHAAEEAHHWKWILEDLANTGYDGPDPRTRFPPLECQAYISFNVYLANKYPVARLGTAAVLEGFGALFGKTVAQQLCETLELDPSQAKFTFGHGDTDVDHLEDITQLLNESQLSEHDWAWLTYAAQTGGTLYRRMYEAVVR